MALHLSSLLENLCFVGSAFVAAMPLYELNTLFLMLIIWGTAITIREIVFFFIMLPMESNKKITRRASTIYPSENLNKYGSSENIFVSSTDPKSKKFRL